jgi:hypothetical protein
MTAILVGKAPFGNVMITDAMVINKEETTSYRDCRLKNKITYIESAKTYCSVVGDENILYGIQALDYWATAHKKRINFTKKGIMLDALTCAEKYLPVWRERGDNLVQSAGGTVYFVNESDVFKYEVSRTNDHYTADDCAQFRDNEVIINYGGYIEDILFQLDGEDFFKKGKRRIEELHTSRKQLSIKTGERMHLEYDFANRFCAVMFPYDEEPESAITHLPFQNLSEAIAMNAKNCWSFIDDENFRWSPDFE